MKPYVIFTELFSMYGPQGWWPLSLVSEPRWLKHGQIRKEHGVIYGIARRDIPRLKTAAYDPYFDIAVGAILTQNASWKNAARAILQLAEHRLLAPRAIAQIPARRLETYIKSSGYFAQKTKKLKIFARYLCTTYNGGLRTLLEKSTARARSELLGLWGIGKETADSILLYAGNKPIFVVDAYTKRLCASYGAHFKDYDDYQAFFMRAPFQRRQRIKNRTQYYQEFHALIVRWGKEHRG